MELNEVKEMKVILEKLYLSPLFPHKANGAHDTRGTNGTVLEWIKARLVELERQILDEEAALKARPMDSTKFRFLLDRADDIQLGQWLTLLTRKDNRHLVTENILLDISNQIRGIGSYVNQRTGREVPRNGQGRPMTPGQTEAVRKILGKNYTEIIPALLLIEEGMTPVEEVTVEMIVAAAVKQDAVEVKRLSDLYRQQKEVVAANG